LALIDDPQLREPECWISLRSAEADRCAVTIAGSLTADAGRLVRRWVVLLRDAVCGEVTIHCDGLVAIDGAGARLLRELIWGLEAQGRAVDLVGVPPRLLGKMPHLARQEQRGLESMLMAGAECEIAVAVDDTDTVVTLTGEIDLNNAFEVDERLAAIERNGRPLIVDCTMLEFCDSTGLAALVRHRPLVLRAPHPNLVRVLEITGLTDLVQ
jgi:anti-anti-sigma factor